MKLPKWLKIGCGCLGAIAGLVVIVLVGMLIYVVHTQRAYEKMADTHDLKARVEALVRSYSENRPQAAVVVGIFQQGKVFIKGFGRISATDPNSPDGKTIFEIGSITKVFTTIELAEMVEAGAVKLDDPISLFLPKEVTAPSEGGQGISLKQLATHTSGLPRLPRNLMTPATDQENPYAAYHETNLYADLSVVKLQSVPGKKYDYSNYGMGLLGHLLAVKAGRDYETLIRDTVCAPLRMNDTVIQLSTSQRARLAEGHDRSGHLARNWDMDVLAPAGAFRSDVDDLIKFLAANLAPEKTSLGPALIEAQREQYHSLVEHMGLGWHISELVTKNSIHWKNGATGGYIGFVGFDKDHQVGVVMLSSSGDAMKGDFSMDKICMEILRLAPKVSLE